MHGITLLFCSTVQVQRQRRRFIKLNWEACFRSSKVYFENELQRKSSCSIFYFLSLCSRNGSTYSCYYIRKISLTYVNYKFSRYYHPKVLFCPSISHSRPTARVVLITGSGSNKTGRNHPDMHSYISFCGPDFILVHLCHTVKSLLVPCTETLEKLLNDRIPFPFHTSKLFQI